MLKQAAQILWISEIGQLSFENDSQLVLTVIEFFVADGENDTFGQRIDALHSNKSAMERFWS
jgi:hypothetical protein